ncbi:hypothetical protein CAC42_6417 [Sphaceloma murrayae]|uniref:STEEP1 domain-containing protein n=1 Tax=Sphaceloma murrayae TaxID=2082308 RepID=A0A2K1QN83_9PEZI|nr:hypothetical protein CAC42_6417 [Sphaceloma murrayae]
MGSPTANSSPEIHTYHCPCTSLLFATSTPLTALPKRRVDHATVLPLNTTPIPLDSLPKLHTARLRSPLDNYVFEPSNAAGAAAHGSRQADGGKQDGGTLPSAVVIGLEDGFEKRELLRCGRCEGVWGYALDWESWGGEESGNKMSGRRDDVIYVLDKAVVGSDEG